jgi:hypothetical protein
MPGPEYYRRQADICLALSLLGEDPIIAEALIGKATAFLAKAKEVEPGTTSAVATAGDRPR